MKHKLLYILVLSILVFSACEKTEDVSAKELEGSWAVLEQNGDSYEVTITVDPNVNGSIRIANFLNLAQDPETRIPNYMLFVKVEGSRLVVVPQQVNVVEILNSSGIVNSKDQFRLDYNYNVNGSLNNAVAYFTRN